MRVKLAIGLILGGMLLLGGCVNQNAGNVKLEEKTKSEQKAASQQPPKQQPAAVVEMHEREFVPARLSVHVGERVEWKNTSSSPHRVSSNLEKAVSPEHASVPKGAEELESGEMSPASTYTYTFKVPGTYKYMCTYHEKEGMVGEVDVK